MVPNANEVEQRKREIALAKAILAILVLILLLGIVAGAGVLIAYPDLAASFGQSLSAAMSVIDADPQKVIWIGVLWGGGVLFGLYLVLLGSQLSVTILLWMIRLLVALALPIVGAAGAFYFLHGLLLF